MKHCPNADCPHARRHRIAVEYRDDIECCADCATVLVDGPAVESAAASRKLPSAPWLDKRLAVSMAGVVAAFLGTLVVLPGIDERLIAAAQQRGSAENLSVVALGVYPFVSATVLVEGAALLIPRWRRLRRSSVQERLKLFRASLVLTPLLAFFQGFGMAMYLEGLDACEPGWGHRLFTSLTLSAGTALVLGIAAFVHRFGVGNGVSVILAGAFAPDILRALQGVGRAVEAQTMSPPAAALGLGVLALPAYATWRFAKLQDAPARTVSPGHLVRLPSSGLVPITVAASLLAFPATLGNLGVPGVQALTLAPRSFSRLVAEAALVVALCAAFSLLFHLPKNVARVAGMAPSRAHLVRAIAATSMFLLVLVTAQHLTAELLPPAAGLDVLAIVVLAAVVMDIGAELISRRQGGELQSIWPIHQVYAAQVATLALRRKGIAHHARGLYHRTLLQFGGPYVPIEIMVRPEDAERARRLLVEVLSDKDAVDEAPGGSHE